MTYRCNSTRNNCRHTRVKVSQLLECDVNVRYKKKDVQLPLVAVEGAGPPLLGRYWLQHINLDWHSIFVITGAQMTGLEQDSLQKILSDNDHVFGTDGLLRDRAVRISVKDTNPKYCKS